MKDPLIEFIVKLSEGTEDPIETPITLLAGGLLVSGHVISKSKFMEGNSLTDLIEKTVKEHSSDAEDKQVDDRIRRFIHLRDARYFSPGQAPIPSNEAITCRIKISDISAFHFGYLSTTPAA